MCVCIYTGNIVWINGPFKPGLYNDKKIVNENLKHALPAGEYVIADRGYRGHPDKARVPNEELDTEDVIYFNQTARARQENTNHLLIQWKILRQIYRHDPSSHVHVFWSIAVTTQISFDMNEKMNHNIYFQGEY
jgi:DDE superfamily endonuclease